MAEHSEETLVDRRGLIAEPDGNRWDAVLLHQSIDAIANHFEGMAEVERLDAAALDGETTWPAQPFYLFVQLRSHPWSIVLNGKDNWPWDTAKLLAETFGSEVIYTGYEDTSSAWFYTLYRKSTIVESFSAPAGSTLDELNFNGDESEAIFETSVRNSILPADFETAQDFIDAFLIRHDALAMPLFETGDTATPVALRTAADELIEPSDIAGAVLVVFKPDQDVDLQGDIPFTSDDKATLELYEAIRSSSRHRLRKAIAAGANVNARLRKYRYRPLYLALTKPAMLRLLIAAGADVNQSNSGLPDLVRAYRDTSWNRELCKEVITLLTEAGADLNIQTDWGRSILFLACDSDQVQDAAWLIGLGADVNLQDDGGCTPLFIAAAEGHIPMCELLIGRGGDPLIRNARGETAADYARAQIKDRSKLTQPAVEAAAAYVQSVIDARQR